MTPTVLYFAPQFDESPPRYAVAQRFWDHTMRLAFDIAGVTTGWTAVPARFPEADPIWSVRDGGVRAIRCSQKRPTRHGLNFWEIDWAADGDALSIRCAPHADNWPVICLLAARFIRGEAVPRRDELSGSLDETEEFDAIVARTGGLIAGAEKAGFRNPGVHPRW